MLQQHRIIVAPAPGAPGACCDWLRGLPSTHLGHRRRGASPRRMQQALHCIKHLHHATSTLLILELRRRLERTGVGNAGAEECSVEWHTPPVRWLCAVLWYATVGRPKGRTWLERMCATRIVCPARDYVAPHTRRGGGSMADGTCWGGRRCASARQRYTNRHVGRSFATNVVRAVWGEVQRCPRVSAPLRRCRDTPIRAPAELPVRTRGRTSSRFGSADSRCELTLEVRSGRYCGIVWATVRGSRASGTPSLLGSTRPMTRPWTGRHRWGWPLYHRPARSRAASPGAEAGTGSARAQAFTLY